MKTSPALRMRLPVGRRFVRRPLVAVLLLASTFVLATHAQQPPSPWQSSDIGTTATGSTSYNSGTGTFTIAGGGDDIWGTADHFRYVHQNVSGDFTITAKVESVQNTNAWAKAGVMIRAGTGSSARYAFVFITPSASNGGKFEYRAGTTAGDVATFANSTPSHWVRLARSGNAFTASQSEDNVTWNVVGTQTVAMDASVEIGLAVCSSVTSTLCTAVFSNVSVANGLPGPWVTSDVGTVGLTGSASHSGGTFTVTGAGTEVYYTDDSFRYVYRPVIGDATIVARVATEDNTSQWAKVGLMFRDDLEPDSRYCFLALTPDQAPPATDRGFLFEYRAGTDAAQNAAVASHVAPQWLKLTRTGNSFTAFRSTDGSSWTAVGTAQNVPLNSATLVGLAVCSHATPYALNTSTFTNVSLTTDTTGPTIAITQPADLATVSGTSVQIAATATDSSGVANVKFYLDSSTQIGPTDSTPPYEVTWDTTAFSNAQHVLTAQATDIVGNPNTSGGIFVTVSNSTSLPSGWTASDIGTVGAPGSTNYTNGTYTIAGSGANIWNTADEFQFARTSMTGDCTIVARVASVDPTANWSKAGIMIRETDDPNSKYVFVLMTPTNGLLFEKRDSDTAPNNSSTQPGAVSTIDPPQWLKLTRSGNTFTAYYSSDGSSWTPVGSPQTVSMSGAALAGLAVCSVSDGNLCTAVFDNVAITAGAGTEAFNPAFPRLGIYAISGSQTYPAAMQEKLARFHVVFIGGNWEGWENGRGYTREDVVTNIKAESQIGTKVFQYVIFEAVWDDHTTGHTTPWNPTWKQIAVNNNWFVYASGTSGTRIGSDFNPTHQWVINPTHYTTKDTSVTPSLWPFESAAKFSYDLFVNPNSSFAAGNKAPSLDGFFLDNTFWTPRMSGDWNRDSSNSNDHDSNPSTPGIPDHQLNDVREQFRIGEKDFYDKIRALWPGKIFVGNNTDFPRAPEFTGGPTPPQNPDWNDLSFLDPLNQVLQGGVCEAYIGRGWSFEDDYSTANVITRYGYTMDAVAAPKLQLFEHSDLSATGTDYADSTPYRAMRYGLAMCLMNDGYHNAEGGNHSGTPESVLWFDEFSVYNGQGQAIDSAHVFDGIGYLGHPVAGANGAVQTGPRWPGKGTHGVWAREFEHGIVILNPKGNGSRTITVGASGTDLSNTAWKRIQATPSQDTTTNNGSNVTSDITLAARDAIILLRR